MIKNFSMRLPLGTIRLSIRNPDKMMSSALSSSAGTTDENDVLFKEEGSSGIVILNRPKVLNALNLSMVKKIYPKLKEWESTKDLVIMKGTREKAFCAGGDVKSLVLALNQPNGDQLGKDFFRNEYTLNHLIGTYKKPYVALIDGITMGGGVGLSVHGKYRIATERTLFAMPETAIGLFPDVGGTYFLSRLKEKLGIYLGLTGHRLKGHDVMFAGIATHFISSDKLEDVTAKLIENPSKVNEILEKYSPKNVLGEFSLKQHLNVINDCFSAPTVEEIVNRLKTNQSQWALKVLETLKKMSPTALKVTKKAIEEGKNKTLSECLVTEYRLACASLNQESDFAEGVRALLIDKDQNPSWNPKTLEEVSNELIDQIFAFLPIGNELILSKL